MLFECRFNPPACSARYDECRRLFLAGQILEARAIAEQLRRHGGPELPADSLLCADISRACSRSLEYFATVKLAARRWPDSRLLRLMWGRVQSTRNYTLRANALFEELHGTATGAERGLIAGMLAASYAAAGFGATTRRYCDEALELGDHGDPLLWYEIAYAENQIRQWDRAIEYGYRVLQLAPGWQRARLFLVDGLLSRSRLAEARQVMDQGLNSGFADAGFTYFAALQAFARNDLVEAERILRGFCQTWKLADEYQFARHLHAHVLWDLGRADEARALATACDPEFGAHFAKAAPGARRVLLPSLLIAQEHNLCVPTTVAMAAAAQDVSLDPRELYEAMNGRDGVAMWRMVDVLRQRGFRLERVYATDEVIRALLDQGVPLIGEQEGIFSNHVELLCGYDDSLDLYYFRDPMSWIPGLLGRERVARRYQLSGGCLTALIVPARVGTVRLDPAWISAEGTALLALCKYTILGEREPAERAFAAIADGAEYEAAGRRPVVSIRDAFGEGVTITPGRQRRTLEAVAADKEAPLVARIRALLDLARGEKIAELLEQATAEEDTLGGYVRRHLQMIAVMDRGEWAQALALIDRTLDECAELAHFWAARADALAELGRLDEARKSIAAATEIAPDTLEMRMRARRLEANILPYSQQVAELADLIARHPDVPPLKRRYAMQLRQGGDGLAYEAAEHECEKFFPRLPETYERLAGWYLNQGRDDLAGALLARGRALIGEEELPKWDFEVAEEEEKRAATTPAEPEGGSRPLDGDRAEGGSRPLDGDRAEGGSRPLDGDRAEGGSRPLDGDRAEGGSRPLYGDAPGTLPAEPPAGQSSAPPAPPTEVAVQRPAPTLPDENREALFDEAHRALAEDEYDNPDQVPAMARLLALRDQGRLPWYEAARLHTMRFQALAEVCRDQVLHDRVAALLAEKLPGPPLLALDCFLDQCDFFAVPRPAAAQVLTWALAQVNGQPLSFDLRFNLALLHEVCGNLNRAESDYRALQQESPAFAAAHFRVGRIFEQRGDLQEAVAAHASAVQAAPGLRGSLEALVDLCQHLGRDEEALDWRRAICRMAPYSVKDLADLIDGVQRHAGVTAALAELDQCAARYRAGSVAAIRAQALCEAVEPARARETLMQTPAAMELHPIAVLSTLYDCAEAMQDEDERQRVIAQALERVPDHPFFLLAHVRQMKNTDAARQRVAEAFGRGVGSVGLANFYLEGRDQPAQVARAAVEQTPAKYRDDLAQAFNRALSQPELREAQIEFLIWCETALPHLLSLRDDLIVFLDMAGRVQESLAAARRLHESDPENPRGLSLLARCLENTDRAEARRCLEQEYALTNAVDCLCQIGRIYSMDKQYPQAIETFRKVLARAPDNSVAIANLFLLGEPAASLFDHCCQALESGDWHAQYFHVAAVQIARQVRRPLPVRWIATAVDRLREAEAEAPFRDEYWRLRAAIHTWLTVRRHPEEAHEYRFTLYKYLREWLRNRGHFDREMLNLLWWPGRAWIPPPERKG